MRTEWRGRCGYYGLAQGNKPPVSWEKYQFIAVVTLMLIVIVNSCWGG